VRSGTGDERELKRGGERAVKLGDGERILVAWESTDSACEGHLLHLILAASTSAIGDGAPARGVLRAPLPLRPPYR
jgi:hypothetical protein